VACIYLGASTSGCQSDSSQVASAEVPSSGPITIALTGDTSFASLNGVTSNALDLVRSATLGFTNLEVALLDDTGAAAAQARPAPRWTFAPASDARRLRESGFDLVSLANNHAMDFGGDGLASTLRALDAAGIVHAGAGDDLAAARAAALVGTSRRVALVAVTASASDQSRASAAQPDINGRPGVSPLLFDAAVTVDAVTFQTLAQSVVSLQAGPPPGEHELTMFGRRIQKGDATRVDFTLSSADEQSILAAIRAAREQAEYVVVSLHSHEPVNDSEDPAGFAREFAHDAVDAGAQFVVGHGPHRLRGVEIYKGVPIFYSLGNFLYDTTGLDFRAADPFDAGHNLYTAALGASAASASPFAQLDQASWWQTLIVVVTEENGMLTSLKLHPATLRRADQTARKGVPQLAAGEEAGTILRQFSELSRRLGTVLPAAPSDAVLELPIPKNR
jgi:poly-gamma-glutamate capsule biosynthesis protein CapA/YwtB (metallophosphatase superfamily)